LPRGYRADILATTYRSTLRLTHSVARAANHARLRAPEATSNLDHEYLKYLTAAQVAQLLQLNEKTVCLWSTQDATMPALRIGGVVRFHVSACSDGFDVTNRDSVELEWSGVLQCQA
jgi:hypothetical protein